MPLEPENSFKRDLKREANRLRFQITYYSDQMTVLDYLVGESGRDENRVTRLSNLGLVPQKWITLDHSKMNARLDLDAVERAIEVLEEYTDAE